MLCIFEKQKCPKPLPKRPHFNIMYNNLNYNNFIFIFWEKHSHNILILKLVVPLNFLEPLQILFDIVRKKETNKVYVIYLFNYCLISCNFPLLNRPPTLQNNITINLSFSLYNTTYMLLGSIFLSSFFSPFNG